MPGDRAMQRSPRNCSGLLKPARSELGKPGPCRSWFRLCIPWGQGSPVQIRPSRRRSRAGSDLRVPVFWRRWERCCSQPGPARWRTRSAVSRRPVRFITSAVLRHPGRRSCLLRWHAKRPGRAGARERPRPPRVCCLDGRGWLSGVLSGCGVGEGAAVVVEVAEAGRAVGQRGGCGYRGPVDQGLPVGVHRGAVRRVARVHPDHGPVVA
jgi:hypothetical protein